MFGARKKRRERLRQTPLPPQVWALVERRVPHCRRLSAADRLELQGLVQVFLAEKNFEGCGGLEVTDEMRWIIASLACLLLLHRETDFYPLLQSILVYPRSFVANRAEEDEHGLVTEEDQELLGETWSQGSLVLSWEDVVHDLDHHGEGLNVVIHEFAHQLDEESGIADGTPVLPTTDMYGRWADVFSREFHVLRSELAAGQSTLLDGYGGENETEFFAVVTEMFFELPDQLAKWHPELYCLLVDFYGLDPAHSPGRDPDRIPPDRIDEK